MAQPDATPLNTGNILKELQKIKSNHDVNLQGQLSKSLQMVNSAASNGSVALDYYLQAQFSTQFDGQNHDKSQFQEWKKKQSDKLKSKSFQEALRLYMVYLSLTIQSSMGVKDADLIPSLVNYTTQILNENEFLADGDEFMKKTLIGSLIVQWLGVNLTPSKNWVGAPANVDEMYGKIILPYYREKGDPSAVDYWNRLIERETTAESKESRTFQVDQFTYNRKPTLYWSRALEFYLIGQKNRGLTEMLAVIKAYPNHPTATNWAEKLEQYISDPATSGSSGSVPSTTGSAGTVPLATAPAPKK